MNTEILKQKINSLRSYPNLDKGSIEILHSSLQKLDDWHLFQINPISFANENGLDPNESIDLFIHGAKIGLFDFEWNLICPMCGSKVKTHTSIADIEKHKIHCVICDIDVETDLSNFIEVSFSINPQLHKINLDPYASYENYSRYYFSGNYHPPQEFLVYFTGRAHKNFVVIEPDTNKKVEFMPTKNMLHRCSSLENNSILRIKTTNEERDDPHIIDIDLLLSGFSPHTIEIPTSRVILNLKSYLPDKAAFITFEADVTQVQSYMKQTPPYFDDFLTGKMLLTRQSFRDLFRIQTLPPNFQLKISDVTILFTDLKSSTELYEKTGDMSAYNHVQDHFELLKKSTKKHAGAIIKTIGDAIMASFAHPKDGVEAAIEMIGNVQEMNQQAQVNHDFAIKVGLHSGTALAVTANNLLDYFGQTVNLAARVQGLAEGSELWMTDVIHQNPEVQKILSENGL